MPVITLLNQKGGVGKSSTCHHLGGTLARMGSRVLLIDNDPQASLTQGFWGPDATRDVPAGRSVAALFDEALTPMPGAIVRPTGIEGLDLVPGSVHLTDFNMLGRAEWGRADRGLRDFVAEVRDGYDVVLIDNPPNLHLCSWASLVASDYIVVPLQAEDYGAQGLGPVQGAVEAVRSGPNPALRLAGYLVTMYDKRLAIHVTYEAMLRELYGDDVFAATFPLAKDYKEAVAARLPISHYKPKAAAAKAAKAVADELLDRVGRAGGLDTRRVA